ncbi:RING finger and WD repeat domain-containing protein 3 [Mitosporidium daphniae]
MNRSSKPSSSSKCPTCNAPTKRSDIRIIFTTNVVAVDTQQLEAMEASLRVAKSAQVAAESQFSQLSSTITALQAELVWTQQKLKDSQDLLRKERILYRSEEKSSIKRFKSIRNGILEFKKSIALGAGAGPRCVTFDPYFKYAIASKPSPSNYEKQFAYGVHRLSLADLTSFDFVPLHCSPIKDMRCSPWKDSSILTASLDGAMKLSSLSSKNILASFEIGVPVWSCCYDSLDINIVYAGCSNGSIYGYDLRKISDPICKCAVEENSSFPIHSLAFDSQNNGLLIGSLRGAYFKKDITDSLSSKPAALALPESLKGGNKVSCTSLAFDDGAACGRNFLVSYRQYPLHLPSIHIYDTFLLDAFEVDNMHGDSFSKQNPTIFYASSGQKTMSRSVVYMSEETDSKAFALLSDEASSSVDLWSLPSYQQENMRGNESQQPQVIQKLP